MGLSPLDLLVMTLKDLGGNKLRTLLTTFGICMGVGAVNVTLNIQAIKAQLLAQQLALREQPNFRVRLFDSASSRLNLSAEDVVLLQQSLTTLQVTTHKGISRAHVSYQAVTLEGVSVTGIDPTFLQVTGRQLQSGIFFHPLAFTHQHPVALVGEVTREHLASLQPSTTAHAPVPATKPFPIGEMLNLNGLQFEIVGVLESKQTSGGGDGQLQHEIWIPQTTATLLKADSPLHYIFGMPTLDAYESAQNQVEQLLAQRYPNARIRLWGNFEDVYQIHQQQQTANRIFQAIAGLALLIAGVSIANITAASIIERTREIGLRRALGALEIEVISQFVMEAILLSVAGGAIAILLVHIATQTAAVQVFAVPYTFQPRAALISMLAALGVGVTSSVLPAVRVTRLDVVQALRGD